MSEKFRQNLIYTCFLILASLFLAVFGKAQLLKTYIELGVGDCNKIPILCIIPEKEIRNPAVSQSYIDQLTCFKFPELKLCMPKDFKVVNERINKVYYKKHPRRQSSAVGYLLYEKPNFFLGLFPRMASQGIRGNYDFISHTMHATTGQIKGLSDTLFVIMKTLFTPDLGINGNMRMVEFSFPGKRGFITYNLTGGGNYFDCNIVNNEGDFFKVYIKDKAAKLDLEKVLTIISTVEKS